jgi:tRNA pseudouridine55 synthase
MMQIAYHGLLIIDKPLGMTSRAAVNRLVSCFPRGTKLGHTGTLDPTATGVLVVCIGSATRLTEYLQDMTKTYRAGILLGRRSDTDDTEGLVTEATGAAAPDRAMVELCLAGFIGWIDQTPPAFCAAKVSGRRAYDLARRGQEMTLQSRRVRIERIDILSYDYPHLEIEVRCGKGTYIRSLARDIGEVLGCGGMIESLRRTSVGPFEAEDAIAPDVSGESVRTRLLPLSAAVAHLARVCIDQADWAKLRRGMPIQVEIAEPSDHDVAVFDEQKELVATARYDRATGLLQPKKVIA